MMRGSRTETREMPAAANTAPSSERNTSPARRSGVLPSQSAPAGSTPSPGLTVSSASARPPLTFTASNAATQSAPGGIGCPASTRCGIAANSTGE